MGRRLPLASVALLGLAACGSPAAHTAVTPPSSSVVPVPPVIAAPTPPPAKPKISKAGLAYFFTVALSARYGTDAHAVVKWTHPTVTIGVHGGDAASRTCLNRVITDFNALSGTSDLALASGPADIEMHFAPVSRFRSLEPSYVAGNDGFFYMHWSGQNVITRATVLIRSTGISRTVRCHLIREELTGAMGLANSSGKYPDSVFYNRYSATPQKYSALDTEVIRLLYSDAVHPGDDQPTVTRAVTVG
ncbi:hypothetical protein ACWT_5378 [Actinoplanes sp. SE50]|uniref:DUF2927 domain-containing protein n=1 Tax=unclassified Actinoplanes TaxID=2626549 RepID=UPI00023EC4D2|nr:MULTISPECIES: DUF2927 domain-containing protein [unclassified Actinoplanes]AEV86396.1 hypothetical protein ACPL_5509 [Actinoplanes sp. SE50/110]ATO84793.1 hypothetical protein ACWT_5378 [Actinoplanes sp. SE50]SLM02203.1 hypothetical protein ACSP50_5441 [Actinoplanes sp. SE50/110]